MQNYKYMYKFGTHAKYLYMNSDPKKGGKYAISKREIATDC